MTAFDFFNQIHMCGIDSYVNLNGVTMNNITPSPYDIDLVWKSGDLLYF